MSDDSNAKITVTLKAGTGYDAPWIVVHADNVAEATDVLGVMRTAGFFTEVAESAQQSQAEWNLHKGLGTTNNDSAAAAASGGGQSYQPPAQNWPAAPQQQAGELRVGTRLALPQGVDAPTCPHGTKDLIHGKYGPFWGCNAQRDDPSKCKVEKYHGPPALVPAR